MYVRATGRSRKATATIVMRLITLSFRINQMDGTESQVALASPIFTGIWKATSNN